MSGGRNQEILAGLLRSEEEGRLPHALILSGPAAEAKVACVERFAAKLFAKGGGGLFGGNADEGSILSRIQSRNHPDFTRIVASEEQSTLDQIRELPRLVAFQPLEAPRRVVLFPDAAELNASAFNAFLKILEEPPAHTMFFLLCRDPGELAQTIVSRCQVLRFAPLSDDELAGMLGEKGGEEPDTVLTWAEGSLERARLLLGEEDGLALRRAACERLLDLWEASPRIPSSSVSFVEGVESDAQASIVLASWETPLRAPAFASLGAPVSALRFQELHPRLAALGQRGGEAALAEIPKKASAINRFRVWRELNGNLRLDFAALLAELQIFSVGNARPPS